MKKGITLLLSTLSLLLVGSASAQSRNAEVKINLGAACVTILNPSFEIGMAKKSAITFDYVGSFSEEDFLNTGHPMIMSMGLFGYRHYLQRDKVSSGFFVGGDFGLMFYRMNKNAIPLIASDHTNDSYDVGYGYVLGMTAGYKQNLGERFTLEASISGGYQNSRHELYFGEGYRMYAFNTTAEWTLYKAALNLGYKLWK